MTDPFVQDAQRRQALEAELISIRIALAEAHERQDAQVALAAINALYKFRERYPDLEVAYMPGGEHGVGFAPPSAAMQMVAKWGGTCILCDDHIRKGDVFYWDKSDRAMFCARCSVKELTGAPK